MRRPLKLILTLSWTAILSACSAGPAPDAPDPAGARGGPAPECVWPPGADAGAPPACPPDCFWDEKEGICKPDRGVIVPQGPSGN